MAIGCAVAWLKVGNDIPSTYSKELLAALLSAAAISAGFLTTALSILLPLGGTETGRKMQMSGFMPSVHCYLRSAIFGCLALAGVCVCLFFLLPEPDPKIVNGLAVVLVIGTVYAAMALVRIAEILLNLFERMSQPEDKQG